jgi:phosphopantothenoylcysteine decarboxylase/phosphopantothenate--cysteine ligase
MPRDTEEKALILGVTGSVAAYKAVFVASELRKHDVEVFSVLTRNAAEFVTPLQFSSVTGMPAYVEMFEQRDEMTHISLADKAGLLLVAPASADFIGKYANGIADDLLSTTALSVDCPALLAPAMNSRMWLHPAVQENVKRLVERGVEFIGPEEGRLACGTSGIGRLAEPGAIVSRVLELLKS